LGLFVILGAVVQNRGVDVVSVEVFTNWEVFMRGEKIVAATRTNEHQGAGSIVGNQREVEGGMGRGSAGFQNGEGFDPRGTDGAVGTPLS
jgi:hypothetical protein